VKPEELNPDSRPKATQLTARVRAFCDASRRGEYYEDFPVNSKNYMENSGGTDRFIVDCDRLLSLCVKHSTEGHHNEAAAAFELIFGVLRHIDECLDDVVFFADEGGSWQIPVDWRTVFPAWFESLAAIADPDEFAAKIVSEVERHANYDRERYIRMARKVAIGAQCKALEKHNREQVRRK
jgi:hypothetical protein